MDSIEKEVSDFQKRIQIARKKMPKKNFDIYKLNCIRNLSEFTGVDQNIIKYEYTNPNLAQIIKDSPKVTFKKEENHINKSENKKIETKTLNKAKVKKSKNTNIHTRSYDELLVSYKILKKQIIENEREIRKFKSSKSNDNDLTLLNTSDTLSNELTKLKIKYKSCLDDIEKYKLEIINLKNQEILTRKRLEELQKWVRENISIEKRKSITKTFLETPKITTNLNEEKSKLGSDNDGSYGFHHSRRENGRYGSLSSFDNYDDDYTENDFDNEFV